MKTLFKWLPITFLKISVCHIITFIWFSFSSLFISVSSHFPLPLFSVLLLLLLITTLESQAARNVQFHFLTCARYYTHHFIAVLHFYCYLIYSHSKNKKIVFIASVYSCAFSCLMLSTVTNINFILVFGEKISGFYLLKMLQFYYTRAFRLFIQNEISQWPT